MASEDQIIHPGTRVPIGEQATEPSADYHGEILTDAEQPLIDPAWKGYKYQKMRPEAFDIDKYNQLAYRQGIRNADNSTYGKLAGIGDNILSAKGMGVHSGSWLSRINEFNADTRQAHEDATYKALAQTIVAQQQKFNQALAAGKMNLETFASATNANMKRLGMHVESAKLASALDDVKHGNFEKFNDIVKVWSDLMVSILENDADREAKVSTQRMGGTAGQPTRKDYKNQLYGNLAGAYGGDAMRAFGRFLLPHNNSGKWYARDVVARPAWNAIKAGGNLAYRAGSAAVKGVKTVFGGRKK